MNVEQLTAIKEHFESMGYKTATLVNSKGELSKFITTL